MSHERRGPTEIADVRKAFSHSSKCASRVFRETLSVSSILARLLTSWSPELVWGRAVSTSCPTCYQGGGGGFRILDKEKGQAGEQENSSYKPWLLQGRGRGGQLAGVPRKEVRGGSRPGKDTFRNRAIKTMLKGPVGTPLPGV